jgi:glycosyltransferase involved in cell wall biosynthesis
VPRVLLLFEPPDGGVAENVRHLARGLGDHGITVEVAGPEDAHPYAELERAGIAVHRLPLRRGFGQPAADLRALARIDRLLRERPPDLVHAHSAKAGVLGRLAARRRRVPAVYSPHCFAFVGPVSARRRVFATAVERRLGARTAAIVCACDAERRRGLERRVAPAERLELVYYGVEGCPGDTAPDPDLAAFGDGGPLVGAVTVLREQKRLDLLIDAAPHVLERVPEARIAIVGDGPLRDDLHAQARRLGLDRDERFTFLAFQPPAARYLKALDLYVLPSAWEAMPIGALEALACGIPQIATDVEGTGEAVDHGRTGLLLSPERGGLADAIVELLQDEGRRREMSEASRARQRERFAVGRMVAETADVYARALSG